MFENPDHDNYSTAYGLFVQHMEKSSRVHISNALLDEFEKPRVLNAANLAIKADAEIEYKAFLFNYYGRDVRHTLSKLFEDVNLTRIELQGCKSEDLEVLLSVLENLQIVTLLEKPLSFSSNEQVISVLKVLKQFKTMKSKLTVRLDLLHINSEVDMVKCANEVGFRFDLIYVDQNFGISDDDCNEIVRNKCKHVIIQHYSLLSFYKYGLLLKAGYSGLLEFVARIAQNLESSDAANEAIKVFKTPSKCEDFYFNMSLLWDSMIEIFQICANERKDTLKSLRLTVPSIWYPHWKIQFCSVLNELLLKNVSLRRLELTFYTDFKLEQWNSLLESFHNNATLRALIFNIHYGHSDPVLEQENFLRAKKFDKTQQACITLIAIRCFKQSWFNHAPKDVVKMLCSILLQMWNSWPQKIGED